KANNLKWNLDPLNIVIVVEKSFILSRPPFHKGRSLIFHLNRQKIISIDKNLNLVFLAIDELDPFDFIQVDPAFSQIPESHLFFNDSKPENIIQVMLHISLEVFDFFI